MSLGLDLKIIPPYCPILYMNIRESYISCRIFIGRTILRSHPTALFCTWIFEIRERYISYRIFIGRTILRSHPTVLFCIIWIFEIRESYISCRSQWPGHFKIRFSGLFSALCRILTSCSSILIRDCGFPPKKLDPVRFLSKIILYLYYTVV